MSWFYLYLMLNTVVFGAPAAQGASVSTAILLTLLSGVPDLWDRNKILSGGDLSHYQVPHCIRVFFYFVWFVFIHHNFQFYFELCTYCNILKFVNYLLFYMKLLNYLFFNMFGSVLECCELTGVSLLWTRLALANKAKIGLVFFKIRDLSRSLLWLYYKGLYWSIRYKRNRLC